LLTSLHVVSFGNQLRQVKIVPADDGVLDEPAATFRDFLLDLFSLQEFLIVAKGYGL